MATLESDDSNIFDAETGNWRLVVYPVLLAVILVLGGVGYYYYQQAQREILEGKAREAVMAAKTPEELIKAADDFPGTTQATLALLSAASQSFEKKDYDAAIKDYQRIIGTVSTDAILRDSAQLGLGSSLEASGKSKTEDVIAAFMVVAERGDTSPYAPYAYHAVATIYDQKGDKENERKILMQAASLGGDSPFVKEAQSKLKELAGSAAATPSVTPEPTAAPTPIPTPH